MQTVNEQQLESLLSDLFELAELMASQGTEEHKRKGESESDYWSAGMGRKVLFCDIYEILGVFTKVDGHFSPERLKFATFLGKSLETDTKLRLDAISEALI